MSLTLHDLFSPAELRAALDEGLVRQQEHPDEPLAILNYTERAAYGNAWNPVTLACRGLVYHRPTGRVLARPFPKFFNHGQSGAAVIELTAPVHVTDKLDGSLGVLYPLPSGGYAVATRGSFASDQALHATEVLRQRYAGFVPAEGLTILVEIVYPANRIVVDYGDVDDLMLLGAVRLADGRIVEAASVSGWPGPVVPTLRARSFAEALALPPRSNAEGMVVRCLRTDAMVKIKQDDYVALHRIVTGLTERTVWQHLVDGKPLEDLVAPLPDEFHDWVRAVAERIESTVDAEAGRRRQEFDAVRAGLPQGSGRKDFAIAVTGRPHAWALFALLDGKDIRPKLRSAAKPGPLGPSGRTFSEDDA